MNKIINNFVTMINLGFKKLLLSWWFFTFDIPNEKPCYNKRTKKIYFKSKDKQTVTKYPKKTTMKGNNNESK